jgi:hypothetical protein
MNLNFPTHLIVFITIAYSYIVYCRTDSISNNGPKSNKTNINNKDKVSAITVRILRRY